MANARALNYTKDDWIIYENRAELFIILIDIFKCLRVKLFAAIKLPHAIL